MELTLDQFATATGATDDNAAKYFDAAVAAMDRFKIAEPAAAAAFLANVSVETMKLTKMEEDLHYRDPERLARLFLRVFDEDHNRVISPEEIAVAAQYVNNPHALSMKLYNGFHGRGGAQLTWEGNYKLHGDKLGVDYVGEPALLLTPEHAMLSAASFWDTIRGNAFADDMDTIVARWNGPRRLQFAERLAMRDIALAAFG